MESTNERIVAAAIRAANQRLPNTPTSSGWCLQLVRLILESALALPPRAAYDRWLVAGTTRRGGTPEYRRREARADPWAADLEASAKQLGWGVPAMLRKPGDLVFNHNAAAPVGHVAILLTRDMVLENIHPTFRPTSIHLPNSLSITPFAAVPWTLVARVKS